MHVLRRVLVVAFVTSLAHLGVLVPAVSANETRVLCPVECQRWVDGAIRSQARAFETFLARRWYGSVIAGSWPATCVALHESETSGSYLAENPVSTASGRYQMIDSTWSNVARARGRLDLVGHASNFPDFEQDLSFGFLWFNGGQSHWAGTGC